MINIMDVDYHFTEAHRRRLYEDADRRSTGRRRFTIPYRSARNVRRKR